MRIMVIGDTFGTGGAEVQIAHQTAALGRRGQDVRIILVRGRGTRFAEYAAVVGETKVMAFEIHGRALFSRVMMLAREIRAWAPDIVYSWHRNATVVAALAVRVARLRGSRFSHITSQRVSYSLGTVADSFEWLRKKLVVWGEKSSELTLFNSVTVRNEAITKMGYTRAKTRVVLNGARCPIVDIGNRLGARKSARARLSIPESAKVVLFLARLHTLHKSPQTVLKIWPDIVSRYPTALLIFVGGGDAQQDLMASVRKLQVADSVRFEGEQHQVADYLMAADLFVSTSMVEGFSNSIVEAMCAGLPVVSSAVAGACDLLSHGRSGLLFEPGDHSQLLQHVLTLLGDENLRSKMGAQASRTAAALPDFDAVADRTLSYCNSICNGKPLPVEDSIDTGEFFVSLL